MARRPAYFLIVSGPDNRLRFERFADASSYKTRLAALRPSNARGVSIDEVVDWIDGPANRSGEPDDQ